MTPSIQVSMNPTIQVGSTCFVQGLQAQPAYNGHSVKVVQFDQSQGRYMVQPVLPGSILPPILSLLPQNLVPSAPGATSTMNLHQPGSQHVLYGLHTAAFNGQMVSVVQFLPTEQRYQVRPETPGSPLPPLLHIKPDNLRPLQSAYSETSLGGSQRDLYPQQYGIDEYARAQLTDMRGFLRRSGSLPSVFDDANESIFSAPVSQTTLIPKGSKARLKGLQLQPSLNDSAVEVLDYISKMGRYRVSLKAKGDADGSPRYMVVQPQNLRIITEQEYERVRSAQSPPEDTFLPGCQVKLTGLQSQPHLNGTIATVYEFIRETGRYSIQIEDDPPQVMMLLPRNLQRFERRGSIPKVPSSRSVVSGTSTISTQPINRKQSRRHSLSSFVPLHQRQEIVSVDDSEHEGLDHFSTISVPEELIAPGTRVVLVKGLAEKPSLSGELAVVMQYLPGRQVYRVRLLGMKAISKNGHIDEVTVAPSGLEASPISAFWVTMTLKGQTVRIPAACEFLTSCKRLRAKLDAFPGIERVMPAGKLLLGDDKCDWFSKREVLSTLSKNPTPPLKCVVPPSKERVELHDDEVLVDVPSSATNVFFKAMVEYELLRPTGSRAGGHQIYKVCFPVPSSDDDENPFANSCSSIGSLDPAHDHDSEQNSPRAGSTFGTQRPDPILDGSLSSLSGVFRSPRSVTSSMSTVVSSQTSKIRRQGRRNSEQYSPDAGSTVGTPSTGPTFDSSWSRVPGTFRSPNSVTSSMSTVASSQSSKILRRQGRRHSLSDSVPNNPSGMELRRTSAAPRDGAKWVD